MGKRGLIIPDPHANPNYNNDRFDWLGALIMHQRPEFILCLGDFGCMPSLSGYDKGKRSFEGQRYQRDVDAVIDAQKRMFGPMQEYNARCRRFKVKQYLPETILLGGNHDEGRITRVTQEHPELHEFVSNDNLLFKRFWNQYVPFLQSFFYGGIEFCHYLPTGVSGRPISGVNLARSLLNKRHNSAIVGHNHTWDAADTVRGDGKRLTALCCGWYGDYVPHYAENTAKDWWSGVVFLNNVKDGEFDYERIGIERVRTIYGHS